jgi:hypothetical protein
MTNHCSARGCQVPLQDHQVFCLHHGMTVPHLVRCPNGITTRHPNLPAAVQYADHGHCCVSVAQHQIRSIPS